MEGPIEVFWDYCCPFTRNLSLGLLAWSEETENPPDLVFRPFSLMQHLLPDDELALWDRGAGDRWGVTALLWGLAVQIICPQEFPTFHRAVFDERFENGNDVEDLRVLRSLATRLRLPLPDLESVARSDEVVDKLRVEHHAGVADRGVFGVPTVVVDGVATFVRVLDSSPMTAKHALELIDWAQLHEFKSTALSHY